MSRWTRIDLNADMGEGFDDERLLPLVTSANIACGFHAGDPALMARTVAAAARLGVGIGAHPGFPDKEGFGRRGLPTSSEEVRDMVAYQIGALEAFARRHSSPLQHVKPHGALYTMAERDPAIAQAIAQAVAETAPGAILMGLSGGRLVAVGRAIGLNVASEVFADRAYLPDGRLMPRERPNAVLHDPEEVVAGMARLMTREADTLCLHGDAPNAVALAAAIRAALARLGIAVRRLDAP